MLKRFFIHTGAFSSPKYEPKHTVIDMSGTYEAGTSPFKIAENIAAAIGEHFDGKLATEAKAIYDSISKIDKIGSILPFSTNEYPGGLYALQRDAMYLRDKGYVEGGTFYIEEPETLRIAKEMRKADIETFIEQELKHLDLASIDNNVLYNEILARNKYDITFPSEVLKAICEKYERVYIEIQPVDITSFQLDNGNLLNMFK